MAKRQKKSITMLPELADASIIQPNRITKAHYHYNLIQEKIFTLVMYKLQDQMREVAAGTKFAQLDLFQDSSDTTTIYIPLNMLTSANNYSKVRQAAERMTGIPIKLKDLQKKETSVAALFSKVTTPDARSGIMQITMLKEVCELLLTMDLKYDTYKKRDVPHEYTAYKMAVVYQCKNKYTPRLHRYFSSWKEKKNVPPIKIEDFRKFVNLNDGQYVNFNDVKKRVIDPVNAELKKFGDCWINYGTKNDGKRITEINFFVITPKTEEYRLKQMDFARQYCLDNFRLEKSMMQQLEFIFSDTSGNIRFDDVIWKIDRITETILQRRGKANSIDNPKTYALKALLTAFQEFKPPA